MAVNAGQPLRRLTENWSRQKSKKINKTTMETYLLFLDSIFE